MVVTFVQLFFSLLTPVEYVSTVSLISVDTNMSSTGKLEAFFGVLTQSSLDDTVTAIIGSNRMKRDIKFFLANNKKPGFKYKIAIEKERAVLRVTVKGNDASFAQKVANFSIKNLDKINGELNITADKPMVKILDRAGYGKPVSRDIFKKVIVADIIALLIFSLYIFLSDYFRKVNSTP